MALRLIHYRLNACRYYRVGGRIEYIYEKFTPGPPRNKFWAYLSRTYFNSLGGQRDVNGRDLSNIVAVSTGRNLDARQ